MIFACPKCSQALDVRRPKRTVCPRCGSALPVDLLLSESGLANLAQVEADAEARKKSGKSLSSRQKVIITLRKLDPAGPEFYAVAAGDLRKQFRPNRTYGLFFIVLGTFGLLLGVYHWREHPWLTLLLVVSYLFCGAVGLPFVYHSSATLRLLSNKRGSGDAISRRQRLRTVALNNHSDPVAALVLELTEGTNT